MIDSSARDYACLDSTVKHEIALAASYSENVTYSTVKDFSSLLQVVAAKFQTKKELADAIGISASRLSRALQNEGQYTFNVENCLRLADVSGESASDVLRAAGKGEIADLLERLYGGARPAALPSEERELVNRWRHLQADDQKNLKGIVWRLSEAARNRAKRTA